MIKYGFRWIQSKDDLSYLGIHCQNKRYAISSTLNSKGRWSHELLTYQKCSLTGSYSYEPPQRQASWFDTDDINEIVKVINDRVDYWASKEA